MGLKHGPIILDLCTEVNKVTTVGEVWLRKGRLVSYSRALADLIDRM